MAVGMVPPELINEYARRIAERFPMLFLTLGAENLDEQFLLQPGDGAKVAVAHTNSSMIVKMKLPRNEEPSDECGDESVSKVEYDGESEEEEELSPFSRSRKLRNSFGRPAAFQRAFDGALGERNDSTLAWRRRGVRQEQPRSQEMPVARALPVSPPQAPAQPPGLTRWEYGHHGCEDAPIVLSSASPARFTDHFPAAKDWVPTDPGKPVLAKPGSHNPWKGW